MSKPLTLRAGLIWFFTLVGILGLAGWMLVAYMEANFTGIRVGEPFLEAHERAVLSFGEQEGFGPARLRRRKFWNDYSVSHAGTQYPVMEIQLVGGEVPESPKLYLDRRPPIKSMLANAEYRALTEAELQAWLKVRQGDLMAVVDEDRDEGGYLRIIAPIAARETCAGCHRVPVGTLLGAFLYSLDQDPRYTKPDKMPGAR